MIRKLPRKVLITAIGLLVVFGLAAAFVCFRLHKTGDGGEVLHYGLSLGDHFQVGPFQTLKGQQSSGGIEADCLEFFQPPIIGTLEDMQRHMQVRAASLGYSATWNTFSIDQKTLDLLCNKEVTMNLTDPEGDLLILEKVPFERMTSPDGSGAVGTEITIYAAIVQKGMPIPSQPDEYGRIFIPDNLLSSTTISRVK